MAPEPKKRAGAAGKAVGPVTTAARAAFQALCEPLDDRGEAGAAAGLAGPGPGPGSEAARRCVGPALVRDVCSPQVRAFSRQAPLGMVSYPGDVYWPLHRMAWRV